jgi:hypothetical protein
MEEREFDFDEVVEAVIQELRHRVKYAGDVSDLGNEIGYALGKVLKNMTQEETRDFIHGIRHGISLTNGTHG